MANYDRVLPLSSTGVRALLRAAAVRTETPLALQLKGTGGSGRGVALLSLYEMIIYTFGVSVHSLNSASRLSAKYESRQARKQQLVLMFCVLDVRRTVPDRRDVCMFVPSSGDGNEAERRRDFYRSVYPGWIWLSAPSQAFTGELHQKSSPSSLNLTIYVKEQVSFLVSFLFWT